MSLMFLPFNTSTFNGDCRYFPQLFAVCFFFFFTFDPALDYVTLIEVTRITASWKDNLAPKATECLDTIEVLRRFKFFLCPCQGTLALI